LYGEYQVSNGIGQILGNVDLVAGWNGYFHNTVCLQ
jgi:hypothetical protein